MSTCPRKLKPGQYKQIPDKPGFKPIGFYIACPKCGYRCIIALVDEHKAKEVNGKLSTDELKCIKCRVTGKAVSGEFVTT